jgi:DNA-binding beta-propeller fold protein YncE
VSTDKAIVAVERTENGFETTTQPVDRNPGDMYSDCEREILYFTNPGGETVSILDFNASTLLTVSTLGNPRYIYSDPYLDSVYVASDMGYVSAIDKDTYNSTYIPVGEESLAYLR